MTHPERHVRSHPFASSPAHSRCGRRLSDLSRFLRVPAESSDWLAIGAELELLFDQCLSSSPYFAMRGAAQLNTGRLTEAIESLERALLPNPDNGAAMVDYAQALLEDGQLFAAIEANRLVLEREDADGLVSLQSRQRDWSSLTRQTSYQIDLVGGFDDNLNGGPDEDLIALTLAGEPILLTLSQSLRQQAPVWQLARACAPPTVDA